MLRRASRLLVSAAYSTGPGEHQQRGRRRRGSEIRLLRPAAAGPRHAQALRKVGRLTEEKPRQKHSNVLRYGRSSAAFLPQRPPGRWFGSDIASPLLFGPKGLWLRWYFMHEDLVFGGR